MSFRDEKISVDLVLKTIDRRMDSVQWAYIRSKSDDKVNDAQVYANVKLELAELKMIIVEEVIDAAEKKATRLTDESNNTSDE